MDLFDREPAARAAESALAPARIAATAAAALPAVGFGLVSIYEGLAHRGVLAPRDCVVKIVLGSALLVLFADVAVVIQRSRRLQWILLAGVFGFAGAFSAVSLAEVAGPPVLGALVTVASLWALAIVLRQPR